LGQLQAARKEAAKAPQPQRLALTPEALARLESLGEPSAAWECLTLRTRKEIVRALANAIKVYPDLDGYFVVADWE
jgi:hypothetical protein